MSPRRCRDFATSRDVRPAGCMPMHWLQWCQSPLLNWGALPTRNKRTARTHPAGSCGGAGLISGLGGQSREKLELHNFLRGDYYSEIKGMRLECSTNIELVDKRKFLLPFESIPDAVANGRRVKPPPKSRPFA
ncbi:hypothetical protein THAOC_31155 [Thalassiosira oceanica]|uniref:Uncharacterized protein n=1 Tax=Thalassiosira oceanica TaxID=159749 RepID=K0RTA5_THAOC|nr:hypothetical protein THAOC_31155 [Thalassiosira oceanica]|eukprot:EJK49922.1 hypothetical protein THAOC_31155 [Thalassiosira oceanica]